MALFEDGDRENFFRVYDRCIPEQYRATDLDARKVDFWLQIYFAIYPALPSAAAVGKRPSARDDVPGARHAPHDASGANLAAGIAKLREYIETRGADAARTEEFLPYYALPYVPQPQHHPAFKQLFEPKWTIDLRGMLERFVSNAPDEVPPPRILTILKHYYGVEGADPTPIARAPERAGGAEPPSRPPTAPRRDAASPSGHRPSLYAFQSNPSKGPLTSAGFDGALATATRAPRGITPLLEGRVSLDDFCPVPDLDDLGAEVLTLESLAAQVKALEPHTPSDSPPEEKRDERKKKKKRDNVSAESETAREGGGADPTAPAASAASPARPPRSNAKPRASFSIEDVAVSESNVAERRPGSTDSDGSGFARRPLEAKYLSAPRRRGAAMPPYPETLELAPLDYGAIVLEFRSGVERLLDSEDFGPDAREAEDRVSRLLRALRWRVSRAPEGSVLKIEATRTMCRGDVFALRSAELVDSPERGSGSLVDALLLGCRGRVRGECLRLINALASSGEGRRYLLSPGSRVVPALALTIAPGEADTRARRHLLGALQKLSFHAVAARRMCAMGVMRWVVAVLLGAGTTGEISNRARASRENLAPLTEYDAEHGAALLMNLTLTPQGRQTAERMLTEAAADPERDILEVTKMLLQSPEARVRVHANGALYSLLQRRRLRDAARDAGFEGLLEQLREQSDPVFYRQLTHVMGAIRSSARDGAESREDDPGAAFLGYPPDASERFDDAEPFESEAAGGAAEEDRDDPSTSDERSGSGSDGEEEEWIPVGAAASAAKAKETRLEGEELLVEEYYAEDLDDDDALRTRSGNAPEEPLTPYRADAPDHEGLGEEDLRDDLEIDAAAFATGRDGDARGGFRTDARLDAELAELDADTGGFGRETVGPDELDEVAREGEDEASGSRDRPLFRAPEENLAEDLEVDAAAFSTRGVAETGDAETGDDEDDVDVDVGVDEDEDDVEVDDDDEVEVDEDDDVGLALSREIPAGVEDEPEPADPLLSPDAEAAGDVAPVDLPSRGDEGSEEGYGDSRPPTGGA